MYCTRCPRIVWNFNSAELNLAIDGPGMDDAGVRYARRIACTETRSQSCTAGIVQSM